MGDPEEPAADPAAKRGGGLSASGWAAVTALGAATITAAVTLVTHFLPPAGVQQTVVAESAGPTASAAGSPALASASSGPPASSNTSAGVAVTSGPAAVPAPRSGLLDRLTGTWSGPARAGSEKYTLTLVVTGSCAEGRPCGTMTTDLLPCVGSISLVKIDDAKEFDFATGSFSPDSSASCALRPSGGDYFILGNDVLAYRTGYDNGTVGTLHRVS